MRTSLSAQITESEFEKLRQLIYERAGISLNDSKRELLCARLSKRVRELGLSSFDEYYDYVIEGDESGQELTVMLNCISTNKTEFFREKQHFEYLLDHILPELRERIGEQPLRIWSAGCATGEEPYSLAMTLHQDAGTDPVNARILASDISTRALRAAHSGLYPAERADCVPQHFLRRFFTTRDLPEGPHYEANENLRSLITFRRINLMEAEWPIREPLHLIFCRNVMIYFDGPTQEKLCRRFHDHLHPGGYLFVGHSESLSYKQLPLRLIQPTIYRRDA